MDKSHIKWDRFLHESLLTIRQCVSRVTGFSPAELFLGRPIKRTGDWNLDKEHENLALWFISNQRQVHGMNRQAEGRTRGEAQYNDEPEEEDFRPGTQVLRRNHPRSKKTSEVPRGNGTKMVWAFRSG